MAEIKDLTCATRSSRSWSLLLLMMSGEISPDNDPGFLACFFSDSCFVWRADNVLDENLLLNCGAKDPKGNQLTAGKQ